ncbi:MAG TPA: M67 family metallopeptidase [Candidatus Polarisedimenticolaceae bacterium]|nr:M67 family metallopeptidase [Candidatus Polarisedimenticolaceae bacterium]
MTDRRSPPPVIWPVELVERLRRLARRGYPHEVCGLLVGRSDRHATRVARISRARNLATDRLRDRFELDPTDYLRADREARRDGLDVVGVWHTHPDHPARPSATDLASAWPELSYVIVSVGVDGVRQIRCWRLDGGRFVEQPLAHAPDRFGEPTERTEERRK